MCIRLRAPMHFRFAFAWCGGAGAFPAALQVPGRPGPLSGLCVPLISALTQPTWTP